MCLRCMTLRSLQSGSNKSPSITSHPGELGFPFRFSVTSRLVETLGVRGGLFNLRFKCSC